MLHGVYALVPRPILVMHEFLWQSQEYMCDTHKQMSARSRIMLRTVSGIHQLVQAPLVMKSTCPLCSAVTRLEEQIEGFEADVESLGGGEGRRPGPGIPYTREEELQGLIQRHRQHITRLEQVLRLLENDEARGRELTIGCSDHFQIYP